MTTEEKNTYATEKRAHETSLVKAQIDKALEGSVPKAEIEKLIKAAKDGSAIEINKLEDALKLQGEALTDLKDKGAKGLENELNEAIKESLGDIQSIVKGDTKETIVKATVTRASIATNTQSNHLSGIGQLGTKLRSLYDVFRKIPFARGDNKGIVSYTDWDEATIVRAAAIVAEGGVFPESTAGFKEYNLPLIKLGDTLPVTEEFGTDQVSAAAELENFVRVNIASKVDDQIANGTGASGQMKGLIASVPAFVPVASGIVAPNVYDLVIKVKSSIVTSRGSKYNPDIVAANSSVWDGLSLTKDSNQNYIFRGVNDISGCRIVEDNNLPNNVLVVGDSRYGAIYEMDGVEISNGTINDDYTKDIRRIKGRVRNLFLIRTVDQTGFSKVTSISAALTTLAS